MSEHITQPMTRQHSSISSPSPKTQVLAFYSRSWRGSESTVVTLPNPDDVVVTDGETIGQRVKRLRIEKQMTLTALAAAADMSMGYLRNLESGTVQEPTLGDDVVWASRGSRRGDVGLGRPKLVGAPTHIPPELQAFADEEHLPTTDIQMRAGIRFRGAYSRTIERWRFIYNSIRHSAGMDSPGAPT